jgi:hypothetical protein
VHVQTLPVLCRGIKLQSGATASVAASCRRLSAPILEFSSSLAQASCTASVGMLCHSNAKQGCLSKSVA